MNKTISVIVPVYNVETYLEKCVNSICRQTYTNLEILLIDDGSTDGSGILCDTLAQKDARIRVIHQRNQGASAARNRGIQDAKGAYLGFVDSDDFLQPEMYNRLYHALLAHQVDIAQVGREEVAEDGNKLPPICAIPESELVYEAEEFLCELWMHRGDCSFCTKLITKELFLEGEFPRGVLNEDFYLLMKFLAKGARIVSLPYCGYTVLCREGSTTRNTKEGNFSRVYADCVDNSDRVLELADQKYQALKAVALRFAIFQRLEYLLHIPIGQMQEMNRQYVEIWVFMRKNLVSGLRNPYLTKKNKCYLLLFAWNPKYIRCIHKKLKKI